MLQLFEFLQHLVKSQAGNELHDVIRHTVLLADAENGNNVGVVQLGGRFRLALEAQLGLGIEKHVFGQHLQGYVAAEGDLLGLVDDAHAAPANLS